MSQIKELSTRYSEFISFPIEVWAEKTSYDQVPDTSVEVAEGEEPKMKTVTRTAMQWEVRPASVSRPSGFFFCRFGCLVFVFPGHVGFSGGRCRVVAAAVFFLLWVFFVSHCWRKAGRVAGRR